MSITSFARALRFHWRSLSRTLWPETPEQEGQREQADLGADLARCQEGMLRRQRLIERLRGTLAAQEKRAVRLVAQVEARLRQDEAAAWELALELDGARRAAERARARLERHQSAYERQRLRFRRLKERRAALMGRAQPREEEGR
jgi:hypothetical protein